MSSIEIAKLSAADIALMHELLDVFGKGFEDPETYGAAQPDDTYLKKLLGLDTFIALTAITDGQVIGGLAAYVLQKFEQARSEVYIYDLAVLDGHRRQGVATALIEHLKPIAKEHDAWVIFVQADHGDEPAIALYESLGVRGKRAALRYSGGVTITLTIELCLSVIALYIHHHAPRGAHHNLTRGR